MPSKKPTKGNQCQPGGPYCVGMDAMLDADAKRGVQVGTVFSMKTGQQTRTVITHSALVEGKKTAMVFTFCPCCAGRLIAEGTQRGDER